MAAITAGLAQERVLTYPELEVRILQQNNTLKALEKQVAAAESMVLQSRLRLNPELDLLSGEGGEPETVAELSQTLELRGKRPKRTRVAELELEKTRLDFTIRKLAILQEARSAYIDILQAQRVVVLKEETVAIAEQFLALVEERVKAGRLSPVEVARAKIELANHNVALNRARRELNNRWRQLAAFWGTTVAEYSRAEGNLDSVIVLPPEETLVLQITTSPRYKIKDIDKEIQRATLDLAEANRIPDIALNAGFSKTPDTGQTIYGGISVPLPLFNRNQGAIQSALFSLEQVEAESQALKIELQTELTALYSKALIVLDEIIALRNTILPEAQKVYQIINDGYLQGKYGFLDVVDARRTLYQAQENYLSVLADFQKAVARMEFLLGHSF